METDRLPAEVADAVRRLVRDAVGTRARIDRLAVLGSRQDYWVLLATLAPPDNPVVVKLAGPQADHPVDFARTAAVGALVGGTGTPTPRVIATGGAGHHGPWAWQLLDHVAGTPWRLLRPELSLDEVGAAHRQLAETVLAIQTIRFDGFGELAAHSRPATAAAWPDALRARAAGRIRDGSRREVFLDLLDRQADLLADEGPPTLCHDDLHHGNVLFVRDDDRWRLAAVLDWDKAWAAPTQVDVARMRFWDDMTGPVFDDVYRAAVPDRDGDTHRAQIYQLMWCLEYDVDTPRHRDDTRAVAERVGVTLP